ncbi:MAG: DUF167 domain-containing protein [Nitrososphaera sp.]|nr:DUF167 domain-containing protein [Nitrososphaera sp.]
MIVEVFVAPGSKRFSITVKNGRIRIALKNPPENNRANIELVRELSSLTGRSVRILSGHNSRKKKIEIGISENDWQKLLSGLPPA